jgi:hypothetical protein
LDQDGPADLPQAPAELQVFQYPSVRESSNSLESASSRKNSLIAEIVSSQSVPYSIEGCNQPQPEDRFDKLLVERSADHARAGEGSTNHLWKAGWRERIGMQKEEHLTSRCPCPGIHEHSPGAIRAMDNRRPGSSDMCGTVYAAALGNDDLHVFIRRAFFQVRKCLSEARLFVSCGDNDADHLTFASVLPLWANTLFGKLDDS